ncbi:MAG: hypothetical protein K1X74_00690 [Pirellulales bacterium]|nr:hypothetical protein [Pirellulales bacterium]
MKRGPLFGCAAVAAALLLNCDEVPARGFGGGRGFGGIPHGGIAPMRFMGGRTMGNRSPSFGGYSARRVDPMKRGGQTFGRRIEPSYHGSYEFARARQRQNYRAPLARTRSAPISPQRGAVRPQIAGRAPGGLMGTVHTGQPGTRVARTQPRPFNQMPAIAATRAGDRPAAAQQQRPLAPIASRKLTPQFGRDVAAKWDKLPQQTRTQLAQRYDGRLTQLAGQGWKKWPQELQRDALLQRAWGDHVRNDMRTDRAQGIPQVFGQEWRRQNPLAGRGLPGEFDGAMPYWWFENSQYAALMEWALATSDNDPKQLVAPEPRYLSYGTNLVYDNDQVLYNGQAIATAEAYAQQALALAQAGDDALLSASGQAADPSALDAQWRSLGVFALGRDETDKPKIFAELAIRKDGIIAGTAYSKATGLSQMLEGSTDFQQQRVAIWGRERRNAVLDVGLFNLTLDETPVLVHFLDGTTQRWFLVRMEPEDGAPAQAAKK